MYGYLYVSNVKFFISHIPVKPITSAIFLFAVIVENNVPVEGNKLCKRNLTDTCTLQFTDVIYNIPHQMYRSYICRGTR